MTIPTGQLMQPAELNYSFLNAAGGEKPLVLQVGSHVLFTESHIKGAEYAGPGARDEGLKALRDRVSALPRDELYRYLLRMLPVGAARYRSGLQGADGDGIDACEGALPQNNFGADWAGKGYAVESGR